MLILRAGQEPGQRELARARWGLTPSWMTDLSRTPSMIRCHRCGGAEVFQTKIGMMYKDGKAVGGTKQLLCALCFMQGERVVLT